MKVILRQEVSGLGFEYDIVNVKPGYARNFLIPKGMAETATPAAIKVRDEVVKQKAHKEAKKIKSATDLAEALEKLTLKFKMRAQDSGKTYGSVSPLMIVEEIKNNFSYEIDKNDVIMKDNIKEVGEHFVKIKVYRDIQPKIKVVVEREMTEEERLAAEKAKEEAKKAKEEAKRKAEEAANAEDAENVENQEDNKEEEK